MYIHELIRQLRVAATTKIVMVVADGLGGLPSEPAGRTELETARTPHLDACVREGVCGLSTPVLPGITPGSGPGHLALFGYDPLQHQIGRGVLEALGINFPLGPQDIAARGNFCTAAPDGRIVDRRAGRPSTEKSVAACRKLQDIRVAGVQVFVEPVREHRFVLVLRGADLGDALNDTDPQQTGVAPLPAQGADGPSTRTAEAVNAFVASATEALRDQGLLNMVTLRGFARYPSIDNMRNLYGLNPAALAVYPMYKGLARLVGMEVVNAGASWSEQVNTLRQRWESHDFFFLHYKYTDSSGEDGNFAAKVEMIERFDAEFPRIVGLKPDVLIVTGDHSTPSVLRTHSWHPVPLLLRSPTCRPDAEKEFGESACLRGGLGQIEAKYIMPLALAHAGRLSKFGA